MAASPGAESERWCIVLVVVERDGSLVLVVEPTRVVVPCPRCGELSRRQHSRYQRHPLDLPWRGKVVRMRVHSRRWFCDAPTCPRKIFAERFDGALARYARRTEGTTELLTTFALQAGGGGRQGAPDAIQVADRFHLSANASAALDEVLRNRRRHVEYVVVAEPVSEKGPTPTAPVPP